MLCLFRATVTAARRHGDLYFAALLSDDRILNAFGSARLGVFPCGHHLGLSVPVSQSGPFLPRCGRTADRLAVGTGAAALFGRNRRLFLLRLCERRIPRKDSMRMRFKKGLQLGQMPKAAVIIVNYALKPL